MRSKPQVWRWPPETVWEKYCGFLDLSLEQFSQIQRELLMDELLLVHSSPLGRRLLKGSLPRGIRQFRETVSLTTYADYQPELSTRQDTGLAESPYRWAATCDGEQRHFPYTQPAYDVVLDNVMAALILSCATQKGEVNLRPEDRMLWSAPARPALSGLLSFDILQQFGFSTVMDPSEADRLEFEQRLHRGFQRGLAVGMDLVVATTSALLKMGAGMHDYRTRAAGSLSTLNPSALTRLAKGRMTSRLLHREMAPRDLWWPKALLAWGMDSDLHWEELEHYWGQVPYRLYFCAEGGVLALQGWNRKGLTLVPYADFYEFLPEVEAARSRTDPDYQPHCLLLEELQPGERYELVITNLHGMPLLRYRTGHLLLVTSSGDPEAGIRLPQIEFQSRLGDDTQSDTLTQQEETALWEALIDAQIGCIDWIVRQEMGDDEPFLHMYGEFYGELSSEEIASALRQGLKARKPSEEGAPGLLASRPLRVTRLAEGTFAGYQDPAGPSRQAGGRPPRLNAGDLEVAQLFAAGRMGARLSATGAAFYKVKS